MFFVCIIGLTIGCIAQEEKAESKAKKTQHNQLTIRFETIGENGKRQPQKNVFAWFPKSKSNNSLVNQNLQVDKNRPTVLRVSKKQQYLILNQNSHLKIVNDNAQGCNPLIRGELLSANVPSNSEVTYQLSESIFPKEISFYTDGPKQFGTSYVLVQVGAVGQVSQSGGTVVFKNLPKGRFSLRVWHPKQRFAYSNSKCIGKPQTVHTIEVSKGENEVTVYFRERKKRKPTNGNQKKRNKSGESTTSKKPIFASEEEFIRQTDKYVEFLRLVDKRGNIVGLDIAGDVGLDDELISRFPHMEHLRWFVAKDNFLSDQGVKSLLRFKNLESINLSGATAPDSAICKLAQLPNLRKLYLDGYCDEEFGKYFNKSVVFQENFHAIDEANKDSVLGYAYVGQDGKIWVQCLSGKHTRLEDVRKMGADK